MAAVQAQTRQEIRLASGLTEGCQKCRAPANELGLKTRVAPSALNVCVQVPALAP